MEHYLDNSATTKVSQKAAEKAFEIMTENYGNPSSLHLRGMYAEQELVKARKEVARKLGATADEIYFTSGGTEANNLAIFGVAEAKNAEESGLLCLPLNTAVLWNPQKLEDNGFDVVYIMPREDGTIHKEDVLEKVDENTILVSVMCVNNETGAIMNVTDIFSAVKAKNCDVICHTDAVQAFGKISLSASRLHADLISVSGHKIHAPKGVGAIFVKKGVRLVPLHYGGEQEKNSAPAQRQFR